MRTCFYEYNKSLHQSNRFAIGCSDIKYLSKPCQIKSEGYDQRSQLIDKFLEQTTNYIDDLAKQRISKDFEPTLKRVKKEFTNLKHSISKEDKLYWAEKALTWANILQHRAKLA